MTRLRALFAAMAANPARAGFTAVVAVAAVISYDHIRLTAGDHWWAWILPFSIDGLMVAGSAVLWMQRRAGERGSILAWAGVGLGLGMSLWANAAQASPGATGFVVAIWPALALAIGFELLILASRPARRRAAPKPSAGASEHPGRAPAEDPLDPARPPGQVRAVGSSRAAQARAWIHAELDAGREPTPAEVDAALGLTGKARCGSRELRKVLTERERTA